MRAGGKGAPPYLKMSNDLTEFVPLECVPPGFSMKDPSQLSAEAVVSFCNHIWHRQDTLAEEDVFHFRQVRHSRLSTAVVNATYSATDNLEESAEPLVVSGKKRKCTTKRKPSNTSGNTQTERSIVHGESPV